MTTTSTTTSRDECVVEMLGEIRGMVHNFCAKYSMEYDDCYQHATLLMLEVWPKIPDGYNVKAYLNATIRHGLNYLRIKHIDSGANDVSLERSRTEDGGTLLDILQAPDLSCAEAEKQRSEKVEEVVHAVLRECRTEEQEYACTAFGLTAYMPVRNEKTAYHAVMKEKRRTDHMRGSIKRLFRKHPQVLALVQRETCVL